ncbi:hypothetical protein GCM10009678_34220 [Actinomadura kijaniata]|uniref:Uncharacterized protein n=1 Tax=Actinomadura namibiensis TaxID=182080 RepID=A0A7W3QRQ5_ACTNM|nr:hypothetical protein [Actinomadura namibiensis]MBA8957014.1 hypothetical protein [Actinomadura namibiensis]
MSDPGAAVPRCARGAFLAAVCTLIALVGHVLGGEGGCCVPPLPAVLLTGGVVGTLSTALARRALTFGRTLTVVGWSQLAFHLAFSVAAAGPAHHAPPVGAAPAGFGPDMIAGHAVAALVAAAVLARADAALWWLCGVVLAVVLPWLTPRPAASPPAPWTVVLSADRTPRRGVLLARAVRRRGPPVVPTHAR